MPRAEDAGGAEESLAYRAIGSAPDGGGSGGNKACELCGEIRMHCGERGCVLGGCLGALASAVIIGALASLRDCDGGSGAQVAPSGGAPALCGTAHCLALPAMAHAAGHAVVYAGDNLRLAFEFLQPRGDGAAVVCPLGTMVVDAGTVTVNAAQLLAVAGSPTTGGQSLVPAALPSGHAPRLWARFEVSGMVSVSGVTVRDQTIAPGSYDEPQGAAAQVKSGGRLIATQVSFRNLKTTVTGGAVRINQGGAAEFYGCLFDGCHATNGCGDPRSGGGGALDFEAGASGVVDHSTLRNNYAGCCGGGLSVDSYNKQQPYLTNVTISGSTFAGNRAGGEGDDMFVWRLDAGAVPCPEPGEECPVCHGCTSGEQPCCFDLGAAQTLTLTLPCN